MTLPTARSLGISLQEITQAIIALMLVGETIVVITGTQHIPSDLKELLLLVVGFYFGRHTNGHKGDAQ